MIPINLHQKFALFDEYWTPKILGEFNGQLIKIAKLKGEFVWHNHPNEDELFMIVKGSLVIKYRDQEVLLNEGEVHIVPKGMDHFPVAEHECWVLFIEPIGTGHTGDVEFEGTVNETEQRWI